MINSLLKDSHIAQPLQHSNFSKPGRSPQNSMAINEAREYSILSANKKQGIIASKPADVSFRGPSNINLSNEQCLKTLIEKTRKHIGASVTKSKVIKMISEAADVVLGRKTNANQDLTNYVNAHKDNIDEVITKSKALITDNGKKSIEEKKLVSSVRENIKIATDLVHVGEKPSKFLTSQRLKDWARRAAESPAVFESAYAAILACMIRPATIIALPSKKNKDDQKYAASHSIASGAIGYIAALLIYSPISAAVKKVEEKPTEFISPEKERFNYLGELKDGKLNGSRFNVASKYFNMIPKFLVAVPLSIATIALIPPILKYVLGYKKSNDKKANIEQQIQDYSLINFKSSNEKQKKAFQNFTGGLK